MKYLAFIALILSANGGEIKQLHDQAGQGWPTGKYVPRDNTTLPPNMGPMYGGANTWGCCKWNGNACTKAPTYSTNLCHTACSVHTTESGCNTW